MVGKVGTEKTLKPEGAAFPASGTPPFCHISAHLRGFPVFGGVIPQGPPFASKYGAFPWVFTRTR